MATTEIEKPISTVSTEPNVVNQKESGLHFILCRHSIGNIPRIAASLQGYDTVFIECVMSDIESAQQMFDDINAITFADIPKDELDEIIEKVVTAAPELDPYFTMLLAYALYGTNIRFIPVDTFNPGAVKRIFDQSSIMTTTFWRESWTSRVTVEDRYEQLESTIEEIAYSNGAREALVAAQIKAYYHYEPQLKKQNVAVIQGAVHTPTFQQLITDGFNCSREFIDGNNPSSRTKVIYPYFNQAMRLKGFFPERPLPADLLRKIFIEGVLIRCIDIPLDGRNEELLDQTLNAIQSDIIGTMPENQRISFLEQWAETSNTSTNGRKRRLHKLAYDLVSQYVEVEE